MNALDSALARAGECFRNERSRSSVRWLQKMRIKRMPSCVEIDNRLVINRLRVVQILQKFSGMNLLSCL